MFLYVCLFVEYGGQCGYNVPTAFYLFLGLFEYAMYELEVYLTHPFGATLWGVAEATVKIEGCANGYHHSLLQVGLQAVHEYLLLGRAKGYPHYVGAVALYLLGYAFS